MPVDRTVGAQYAERIIAMYVEVEQQLAEIIARGVKRNVEREDLSRKLLQLSEVRRAAEAAMAKIDGKLHATVRQALHDAAVAGGREAQRDLLTIRDRRAVGRRMTQLDKDLVNSPSILRLAAALTPSLESRLRSTHLQVVRSVGDIYQHAVAAMAVPGVLAGVTTRREASQKALDHLWRKGVTGFTDKAGRNWNLATYVEMATRTATAQASVQAHLDELAQNDINLVMVSSDGAPCPRCQPWEGKVLTTGDTLGHQAVTRPSELDGSDTAVRIAGSVAQATADGLFHPSCRHRLVAFLPGLTTPPDTAGEGADVYKAEQQQRALEREARRLAVAQAGAVDPAAVRDLARQYRDKRAQIAQHVKDNPKLRRKTERERIDLGHTPSAVVAPPKATPKVVAPKAKAAPKATIGPKIKPAGISGPKAPRKVAPKVEAPIAVPKAPVRPNLSQDGVRSLYGNRLKIKQGTSQALSSEHLNDLGAIPESIHRRVKNMFDDSDASNPGIHIGDGAVPDVSPESARLKGVAPRGWGSTGKSWDDVPGAFSPSEDQLLLGDGHKHSHGSSNLATHEFGHALDRALGMSSRKEEWKQIHAVLADVGMKPYFMQQNNAGESESFAEAFGTWARHRNRNAIRNIMSSLGLPVNDSSAITGALDWNTEHTLDARQKKVLAAVRRMITIFEGL